MTYAPPRKRLAQIAATEELLHSIDPAKAYPFDYVLFRITGYRRKRGPQDLLTGVALQHDLGLLIEQLSDTLDMHTGAVAEPVLGIDDVTERFNVTSKTIQRWRRRGLPARRFLFPDGKRRVGFLISSVERFFASHSGQVNRCTNFSPVEVREADEILRRARRLATIGRCCPEEITRRIARTLDRSPLTVLHIIRRHDAEHPEQAVLSQAAAPIADSERGWLVKGFRQGLSLAQLSERHGAPRSAVYRALIDERLARLSRRKIRFIDDPLYHQPEAEHIVDQLVAQQELSQPARLEDNRVPRDLPAYLQELYRTPLLSPSKERALFLKFNFHKRQFAQARRRVEPQFVRSRDLEKLEALWRKVVQAKNAIVRANLRLVVSVARKHLRSGLNLMELVSDGNITLMRAVEGFDVHRGNRFSTYATLSLMKGFARSVPTMLSAQRATREAMLGDVPDSRIESVCEQSLHRDQLRHALGQLSDREQTVLSAHYGLEESGPATYEQVGRRLGLSKQRVRQIEQTALAKLREQLDPADVSAPG